MRKLRKSDYLLIAGFLALLTGAVLSLRDIEPAADYVLIAGAVLVVLRGLVRNHEKDDANDQRPTTNDQS